MFHKIYLAYVAMAFLISLLLILPFVLFSVFFGIYWGGKIMGRCVGVATLFWLFLIGVRHTNIDKHQHIEHHKSYIFIANHRSYFDAPLLVAAMWGVSFRVLAAAEFGRFPIWKTLYRYVTVMVDRTNEDNKAKSMRMMKLFLDKGISIFIFPEGKINQSQDYLLPFHSGAFRIAIETQTDIIPIVLSNSASILDIKKGLSSLRWGRTAAQFLKPISVQNYTSDDIQTLKKTCFEVLENHLKNRQSKNNSFYS